VSRMTLIDWLSIWSLPCEPMSFDEAGELMAKKYAELATDADFLWWSIAKYPNEVLGLSRWIDSIGGMFPPPSMTWAEWIDAAGRTG
jgi:hypothetical protein